LFSRYLLFLLFCETGKKFLDKALEHDNGSYVSEKCCPENRTCWDPSTKKTNTTTPTGLFYDFFHRIVLGEENVDSSTSSSAATKINSTTIDSTSAASGRRGCTDRHWMRYSEWIDPKVWSAINFVGHMDPDHSSAAAGTLERDARSLLERIGAWEKYGATGWGANKTSPFLSPTNTRGRSHSTDAFDAFYRYYYDSSGNNKLKLFDDVTAYYAKDYGDPLMDLHVPNMTDLLARRRLMRRQLLQY